MGILTEGTSHHMITIPVTRKLYMLSLFYTNTKMLATQESRDT